MSRETRRLLTAALIAVVSLWLLARIRFPDRPPTSNSLPSLLSPFATLPRFANLASEISDLQDRLAESWVPVMLVARGDASGPPVGIRTGIRLQGNHAIVLLEPEQRLDPAVAVIAEDRATGLTVFQTTSVTDTVLTPWSSPSPDRPRYFMTTSAGVTGIALRPVFIASMTETSSPAWSGPIWLVPPGAEIDAGQAVVTTDGELVGLVVDDPRGRAIVPADVLFADAGELAGRAPIPATSVGIEVQALTPSLMTATRAASGVVVTWVAPRGAASGQVEVGDVIEEFNGRPVTSPHDWQVFTARLAGSVRLRIRRGDRSEDVTITPQPAADAPAGPLLLGLTLRPTAGGAAVVQVAPRTAAARAGLSPGDVITRVGAVTRPSPEDITRAFDDLAPGGAVLVAYSHDEAHLVVGLVK